MGCQMSRKFHPENFIPGRRYQFQQRTDKSAITHRGVFLFFTSTQIRDKGKKRFLLTIWFNLEGSKKDKSLGDRPFFWTEIFNIVDLETASHDE